MEGPAFLVVASPGPCFTCRPTGQLVRSICKGGVASTSFTLEPDDGLLAKRTGSRKQDGER